RGRKVGHRCCLMNSLSACVSRAPSRPNCTPKPPALVQRTTAGSAISCFAVGRRIRMRSSCPNLTGSPAATNMPPMPVARAARSQQAELYAEATRLGPAHDGRQRDLLLRGRQADPNAELLPELHGLTRGHEHASDADVASMTVEDTGVGALAAHAGVDGDPWV